MTEEQHKHLAGIKEFTADEMSRRYTTGQNKNGDNLWEKSPLSMNKKTLEGAIDNIVYSKTERDQWIDFLNLLLSNPQKAVNLAQTWLDELK